MSEDRSSVLIITDAKYGWLTKPASADETDEFILGWEYTGNTNGTYCKHIPALPEVLRIPSVLILTV